MVNIGNGTEATTKKLFWGTFVMVFAPALPLSGNRIAQFSFPVDVKNVTQAISTEILQTFKKLPLLFFTWLKKEKKQHFLVVLAVAVFLLGLCVELSME